MSLTAMSVKDLIKAGCNVSVDGSFTVTSLKEFAKLAKANDVHLTIRGEFSVTSLKEIASIGGRNVTVVI